MITQNIIKCPNCEARVKRYDYDVYIDEDEIRVNRQYHCRNCGNSFNTNQYYNSAGYEIINEEEDE